MSSGPQALPFLRSLIHLSINSTENKISEHSDELFSETASSMKLKSGT